MALAVALNAEMKKHQAWMIGSALLSLATFFLIIGLEAPLQHLVAMISYYWASATVLDAWWRDMAAYYSEGWHGLWTLEGAAALLEALFAPLTSWLDDPFTRPPIVAVAFGGAIVVLVTAAQACPFAPYRTSHGKARKADYRFLQRKRLFSHTGFLLGKFGKRWLRNYNTLSLILLAPPGTGKTVQLIANVLADWPDRVFRPQAMLIALAAAALGVWGTSALVGIGAAAGAAAAALLGILIVLYQLARSIGPADMPGPNMIINDLKGEIRDATLGWRSSLGPCFTLAWGGLEGEEENAHNFNFLDLANLPNGDRLVTLRAALTTRLDMVYFEEIEDGRRHGQGAAALPALIRAMYANGSSGRRGVGALIRNPRLAEMAPIAADFDAAAALTAVARLKMDGRTMAQDVQDYGAIVSDLQGEISRQMTLLIPDTIEAHWRNTGRAAGVGLTLFHIEQSLRLGQVASYGGLLDWLTQVTVGSGFVDMFAAELPPPDGATRPEAVANHLDKSVTGGSNEGNGGQADADKLQKLLEDAVEEARRFGYADRVVSELNDLLNKPDKERGSVISTFGSAIAVFKNPNVRARTSSSSFTLKELRGMPLHGRAIGRWGAPWYETRPVTVYVVVRLEDAKSYGRVTGLFFDTAMNTFLSQPSNQVKKARPIIRFDDEFWSLPPMETTQTLFTLGRGQRLMVYLVGQSYGQLGMQFGQSGTHVVDTLKDSAAYTLVPMQASVKTSKELSEAIGNCTVPSDSESFGRDPGAKGLAGLLPGRRGSRSWTSRPLYSDQDIRSLEVLDPMKKQRGEQLLLFYGHKHIPALCRPPTWFWDKKMLSRSKMGKTSWGRTIREQIEADLDEYGVPNTNSIAQP